MEIIANERKEHNRLLNWSRRIGCALPLRLLPNPMVRGLVSSRMPFELAVEYYDEKACGMGNREYLSNVDAYLRNLVQQAGITDCSTVGLHQPLGFGVPFSESVFPWVLAASQLGFHHVTLHCHVPAGGNHLSVEKYLKEVASCVGPMRSSTRILLENLHRKTIGEFDSYPQRLEEMAEMAEMAVKAGIPLEQLGFVFDVFHMFQEDNFDTGRLCQSILTLAEGGSNSTLRNWIKVIHLCAGIGGSGHRFPFAEMPRSFMNQSQAQILDVSRVVNAISRVWGDSRLKPHVLVEAGTWPGEDPVYRMVNPNYETDEKVFEGLLKSTQELRRRILNRSKK